MRWSREEKFLRRCCQGKVSKTDIPADIDWRLLLTKAVKEDIAPFLYREVSKLKGQGVPDWLLADLKKAYYAVVAQNAVVFDELKKILDIFHGAGIKVIVLKGAVLAEKIYADRGARSMSDVDLLVKPQDLPAIDQAFKLGGYHSDDIQSIQPDSAPLNYLTSVVYYAPEVHYFCFHLHWHLVNSTIPNEPLIRNFKMADIWQAAESANIAGAPTLVMAPHHLLIHLAEHALRVTHSLSKLSLLCDIHATITTYEQRLDWVRFVADSKRFGLQRFIYQTMAIAAQLINAPIPPAVRPRSYANVLNQLKPTKFSFGESLFYFCVTHNIRPSGLSYLLYLSANKGIFKKTKFIFQTLFPPSQVMAQRSGIPPHKIPPAQYLYFRRALEILGTGCKILKKLIAQVVVLKGD